MSNQSSRSNVPQRINISLRHGQPSTVSINGVLIDNLAGVAVETSGDDVDTALVTLKIHVEAHSFDFSVEQVEPTQPGE